MNELYPELKGVERVGQKMNHHKVGDACNIKIPLDCRPEVRVVRR